MPAMRDAPPDDKLKRAVLAKFRRVRAQYARFKQRYGSRLERHWQSILKTAVYSGADRYKRLSRQLNSLSARMAKIRAQAQ